MDFPITPQKIKAYAAARADHTIAEVRVAVKQHINTDPIHILDELKKQISEAIRLKSGAVVFRVYLGSLGFLSIKYNWSLIIESLTDDCLNPLFKEYFPTATYEITQGSCVQLVFNCPEISSQTSSP